MTAYLGEAGILIPESANAIQSQYLVDLKEEKISISGAGFRTFALLKKESCNGILGWVYFLETRVHDFPGDLFLYGGKIEYISPEKAVERSSAIAIARELKEEIGTKFGAGDFDFLASIYGKTENGDLVATDIFTLPYPRAQKLSTKRIKKFQRELRKKLDKHLMQKKKLEEQRDSLPTNQDQQTRPSRGLKEIEDKLKKQDKLIEDLEDAVKAGPPTKVRRVCGHFFQLWPITFLLWPRLNWYKLSPSAAYALVMDLRQSKNDTT